MGLFDNLKKDGLEESGDRLGGFQPFDSDFYPAKIKVAYAGKSAGGAMNITFHFDVSGKEYRESLWITNKKGENFWTNDAGKKMPLPGFNIADDICMLTVGKPLSEQDTEDKVLNVYDPEEGKEMPKSVPVLVDLIGQEVGLGIIRQIVSKNVKNDAGEYVPSDETREENVIDKAFHLETGLTLTEAKNGGETAKAVFKPKWIEKNKGVVRDNRKNKGDGKGQGGKAGKPGGPPQAGATGAPKTSSLFGGKS